MSFLENIGKEQAELNSKLQDFITKYSGAHRELIYDFTYRLNKGKRLRPIAMIYAYRACGAKDKKIFLPAVGIELHHCYSLILDDFMDEDETRWNNPTVYKRLMDIHRQKYGAHKLDDSLFSSAESRHAVSFSAMLANVTNSLSKKALLSSEFSDHIIVKAVRKLEDTDIEICHGQMQDMGMEDLSSSEKDYLSMIEKKTGALFGLSLELGCLFGGANEEMQHRFNHAGRLAAAAFQIKDDLLDLTEGKGHKPGSDIFKGKSTLLLIKAVELGGSETNMVLSKIVKHPETADPGLKRAIREIEETGARRYCEQLMREKAAKARELLGSSPEEQVLKEMIDYFTMRER